MAIDHSSDRHLAATTAARARRPRRLYIPRQLIPLLWMAGALCVAAGLAAGLTAYGEAKPPPGSESEIEQILEGSADEEAAAEPRAAENDPDAPSDQKLYRLTFSPDPQVRRSALEALASRPPTQELRARVKKMADSDDNSIVRGHARLLLADWQVPGQSIVREVRPRESARRRESAAVESGPRDPVKSSRQPGGARSKAVLGESPVGQSPVGQSPVGQPLDQSPVGRSATKGVADALRHSARDVGATSRPPRGVLPGQGPAQVKSAPRTASAQKSKIERVSFEEPDGDESLPLDGVLGGDATGAVDADEEAFWAPSDEENNFSDLFGQAAMERPEPGILADPLGPPVDDFPAFETEMGGLLRLDTGAPLGFTGPSGVLGVDEQESSHFVPIVDRWRNNFPQWNRYPDRDHPPGDDYPYVEGHILDPFNQNVLKGDYPIIGQHTFLNLTAVAQTFQEFRQLPTPATGHESTLNPFTNDAFGNPNQYFTTNFFRIKADLFHGNAAFKPVDWRVVVEGVFNMNDLNVRELGVINPDVRFGTNRYSDKLMLEQYFVEAKLADLSPDYDFLSIRAGSQPFVSDFRGFIFADTNRAIRLFGTRLANRDQFNVLVFDQADKDTNSNLNTFRSRRQYLVIANYSRQDFVFPGYTAQASFHYNMDRPPAEPEFDTNNELVRPDPAGVALPHHVEAYYYGIAGDGHIGRINISHAAYWVTGHDSMNPIAGRPIDIDAQMAAAELSYDRDWVRFRTSYFYASGQHEANSSVGKGFDTILDNPNFAGGRFSFWQRQPIKLLGVNLKQKESLVPDLRSSKTEGQSNFTNPGLQLVNAGMDFQVTPKTRVFTNANYLWFDATQILEQFTFQKNISRQIGTDLSIGTEYRPYLNDNVIIFAGYAALLPGNGLNEIYGAVDPYHIHSPTHQALPAMHAAFLELTLTY